MRQRLGQWARAIRRDAVTLQLAARDPRVPWYAKAAALAVVAYAFSPIDLIPDFIPVIGHLDDVLIVPLGIALAMKLIPAHLRQELRAAAADRPAKPAARLAAAGAIVAIWLAAAGYVACRLTAG